MYSMLLNLFIFKFRKKSGDSLFNYARASFKNGGGNISIENPGYGETRMEAAPKTNGLEAEHPYINIDTSQMQPS